MSLPFRPELAGEEPYGAPQLEVPIALNVNENPFAPTEEIIADIASAVASAAATLNRYPDREATTLREKLAEYLKMECEVDLDVPQIWVANGSNEIMTHILLAFAGPGRSVLSASPTYSMYPEYARNAHSTWVDVPRLDDFTLDLDGLGEAIRTERPAVILLASPNNPTGTALSPAEIAQVLEMSRGHGPKEAPGSDCLVVIDEAYAEFRRPGVASVMSLLGEHENLIVTRTMSKAFGAAGLRLGYAGAAQSVIDQLRIVRLPYHLSAITQAAACAALGHANHQLAQINLLRRERERLAERLEALGLDVAPSDANFLMFGTVENRHEVFEKLLAAGILIREVGPEGWLRVSIGTPQENDSFYTALAGIL